jgi:serine/threonine-protein kinase
MVTGTSYYVSPEQACGLPLTPASDIYSLGIMFYELLAGRRPFTGGSIESILSQHIQAPLPPLPASLERLQPVLDRMTAKDPAERFVSALAVIAALEA